MIVQREILGLAHSTFCRLVEKDVFGVKGSRVESLRVCWARKLLWDWEGRGIPEGSPQGQRLNLCVFEPLCLVQNSLETCLLKKEKKWGSRGLLSQ